MKELTDKERIEKLMLPRYKVIAPNGYHYPNSPFLNGEILVQQSEGVWLVHTKDGINSFHDRQPQNYPHLFKPMPWYEERKIEEMPEYVKAKDAFCNNDALFDKEQVFKISELRNKEGLEFVSPATEADYLSCIKLNKI